MRFKSIGEVNSTESFYSVCCSVYTHPLLPRCYNHSASLVFPGINRLIILHSVSSKFQKRHSYVVNISITVIHQFRKFRKKNSQRHVPFSVQALNHYNLETYPNFRILAYFKNNNQSILVISLLALLFGTEDYHFTLFFHCSNQSKTSRCQS